MDVRIGVTQAKELQIELADDADREQLIKDIEAALAAAESVLWLTDKKGRRYGVPAAKVAYVEVGSPDDSRRVGFGTR